MLCKLVGEVHYSFCLIISFTYIFYILGFVGNYEEIVEDTKPENKTDKKQIKNGEKLVYTCDLTIQTLEFNETIKAINEKIVS